MARLILQSAELVPASIDLNWGITRVGRADDNDFIIRHPSISAHHCEVDLGLDFVRVRDCQSTNGTFINNERIQLATLGPGQVLRFGEIRAVIERAIEGVSVPAIGPKKVLHSVEMEEGIWSCERHSGIRAQWHCPKCDGKFCGPCIHQLRLMKGRPHKLCPVCSAHVEWIDYADARHRKKTVWTHVKRFLRGDG